MGNTNVNYRTCRTNKVSLELSKSTCKLKSRCGVRNNFSRPGKKTASCIPAMESMLEWNLLLYWDAVFVQYALDRRHRFYHGHNKIQQSAKSLKEDNCCLHRSIYVTDGAKSTPSLINLLSSSSLIALRL